MPVTVVEVTTATSATNEISISEPTGVQVGDVLIFAHRAQNTRETYPGPADFTRVTPYIPSAQDGRTQGIWTRVIVDNDPRPSVYTISLGGGATTRQSAAMLLVRGLDPLDPIVDVVQSYAGDYSSTRLAVESLSSDVEAFQLFIAGGEVTDGNPHWPSGPPVGFLEDARLPPDSNTTSSRTALWVGHKTVDPGMTGIVESTWVWITAGAAQSVLFRPLGAQPKLPTPNVVIGNTVNPSTPSSSDGEQTVSWFSIAGASSYSAYLASSPIPSQEDFTLVQNNVVSPYTFTGLSPGTYAFGIQARA